MGMRIRQLPSELANQIAAGEVIERPASVVKELLENSLDAEATQIHIDIAYGGLNQIKISDNGSGIVADDLPLALAAHATSKITSFDDLYAVESMGFRGEALASIASVAKLLISSRPATQEYAMQIYAEGTTHTVSPCARAVGTTIDVVDLFFNAPVRKRFLKNERLEFQAIEQVVKRFALSAPHIALYLSHNNKLVFGLPAAVDKASRHKRITKLLGSTFLKEAVFLDVEQGGMRLRGWISGPQYQRSQSDRQWVYVNQRAVKDKLMMHAIKKSYAGILAPGRFPTCLLYFTIAHEAVDVNVHPTKHEVRFQQARSVHDFFVLQLTKALGQMGAPSFSLSDAGAKYSVGEVSTDPSPSALLDAPSDAVFEYYPVLYTDFANPSAPSFRRELSYQSSSISDKKNKAITKEKTHGLETEYWMPLNKQYALCWLNRQPYLVDVMTWYQQWSLAQLRQSMLPIKSRPLLVPIRYLLCSQAWLRCGEIQTSLKQLGLATEKGQGKELIIRTMPVMLPYLDLHRLLDTITTIGSCTVDTLLLVASQSQTVSAQLLGKDEQSVLQQQLLKQSEGQPWSKHLTLESCRMFIDD